MVTGAISSAMPRWYQIAVIIRNRIINGTFAPGDRIPSESDLVKEFGVSRMTVRQALERLVDEHLIVRHQGIGTMVTEDLRPKPLALTGYLEDLLTLFAQTQVVHVDVQEVQTPGEVGKILQLSEETCVRITRVRTSNSQMFSFSQSYLPSSIGRLLTPEELYGNLLFEILESRFGIVINEAFEIISCFIALRIQNY
jgi:GntR family transcriptional regulator